MWKAQVRNLQSCNNCFWRSYLLIKTITTQFQTVSVFLVFKSRWSEDRIKVLNCHNAHLKHNAQPRNREIKKSSITKTNLVWRGEWNHSLPKCTQKRTTKPTCTGWQHRCGGESGTRGWRRALQGTRWLLPWEFWESCLVENYQIFLFWFKLYELRWNHFIFNEWLLAFNEISLNCFELDFDSLGWSFWGNLRMPVM